MQATYGYKDGAGEWFVTIDNDACDACGTCVDVCPADNLEIVDDEFDFMGDSQVAAVKESKQKSIRYDCSPCKSPSGDDSATGLCVEDCHVDAIEFSW